MIIHIIGIMFVMGTSIGIGFYFVQKDKDRLHLINEMKKMLLLWKGCVRNGNEDIPEVFRKISSKLDYRIGTLLENVVNKMSKMDGDNIRQVWQNNTERIFEKTSLKTEDMELIIGIVDIVGLIDKQLQIENLENYIYEFDYKIKKIKENMIEKHRIYRLLSIVVGLFIVMIFSS